uniref:Nascent polypeptide-associated complex subunit alpha-like UBA domain-containing protein n=1 Tax=Meloidogyne enterolobii TaxID=390850 RepID=A0A6V7TLH8_MELEN|nr:unnamed protein product [Meloidogyne enterolobii]
MSKNPPSVTTNNNHVEDDDVDNVKKVPKEDAQADKQAAADLEKVTDFHEDREAVSEISRESLGNLKMAQPEQKNFTIKRDDIQLIMQELEVPRIVAEAKLIQYEGDLRAAILDLIDCNSLLK